MAPTAEDHARALRWAHVLGWQVQRLRASRVAVMASYERVKATRVHTPEDNEPSHKMAAEAHFTLIAAVQLTHALRNFDGDLRMPRGLDTREVTTLRNALEHWNNLYDSVRRGIEALELDPDLHQWDRIGTDGVGAGRLGGRVEDELLRRWADAVYAELLDFDPPSPWAAGQGDSS